MGKDKTMTILCIRTDRSEAELYLYKDDTKVAGIKWEAHLKLAETIHFKIEEMLNKSSIILKDLVGIVVFSGPGSFTGLRIGISTANALAYSLNVPIIASNGDEWISMGLKKIIDGNNDYIALPDYGRPARTTKQRK